MKYQKMYTARELADVLRLNIMTIYRWIKASKLDASKLGKKYYILGEDFKYIVNKYKNK